MKKLRLGIIGTCNRGKLGDIAHNAANGVEVVACADINDMQRQSCIDRYKKEYNYDIHAYCDYREMIEKEHLDGVFVIISSTIKHFLPLISPIMFITSSWLAFGRRLSIIAIEQPSF